MKIYIVGAGGFGRETLNIYIDAGGKHMVTAFLEENCNREGEIINDIPVYDINLLNTLTPQEKSRSKIIIAIGTPLKERIANKLKNDGFDFDTIIHPSAVISQWVKIGEGTIITANVIITSQVTIGKHVILNLASTVGHDVSIGDFTNIAPGVNISGKVSIGEKSFIGTGTSIVEGVTIGSRSFIGAGSVVTKDIPDDVLAFGNPARIVRTLSVEDWKKLI